MRKVLYLLNFAGKAGTERYVETLVKYLSADGLVKPYFAYNEGGLLVERLEAMGGGARGRNRENFAPTVLTTGGGRPIISLGSSWSGLRGSRSTPTLEPDLGHATVGMYACGRSGCVVLARPLFCPKEKGSGKSCGKSGPVRDGWPWPEC